MTQCNSFSPVSEHKCTRILGHDGLHESYVINTQWKDKILEVLDGYDWASAFEYAGEKGSSYGLPNIKSALYSNVERTPFERCDVTEIISKKEGTNDEAPWLCVGKLRDGRYFFLNAWCDYTGWDCQAGGEVVVSDSLENLLVFGIDDSSRRDLTISLESVLSMIQRQGAQVGER